MDLLDVPELVSEIDDIDESSPDPSEHLTAADVSDVLLYTLDWSVQSLLERIGTTLDINPTFQRRDAWGADRKSRYIESLMLGLPVPQIVLAEDQTKKGQFIVLDGKQRLVTMKQFAAPDENFPALKLRDMEFLPDLNGQTFEKIRSSLTSGEYAENLLTQPVRTIVVRNWRQPAVLYQVFLRLNQGSLPLSPQELRQALFPGEFSAWVNGRSAKSNLIQMARRLKQEDFRMRDAEMLLRYLALQEAIEDYNGNLREFLDEMCRIGNLQWQTKQKHYEALATQCEMGILRTITIFDKNAFLRFEGDEYIRRFNIAVFDMMSLVLGSPELSNSDINNNSEAIREGYQELCRRDATFQDSLKVSTKTARATRTRILGFGAVVKEATGIEVPIIARAATLNP